MDLSYTKFLKRFYFVVLLREVELRGFGIFHETQNRLMPMVPLPSVQYPDSYFLAYDLSSSSFDSIKMVIKTSKSPSLLSENEDIMNSDVKDHRSLQV